MIYPSTFEQKVGFDSVRMQISDLCSSPQGRRFVTEKMRWESDHDKVVIELTKVNQMKDVICSVNPLDLTGIIDAAPYLAKIAVDGMFADVAELVAIRMSLKTAQRVKDYFDGMEDGVPRSQSHDLLFEMAKELEAAPPVVRAISRIIDDKGRVKDNASPELANIRMQLSGLDRRISSAMRKVVANGIAAGIFDSDTAPSVRDGRLVVPVQPMHKRAIPGIVHDHSASGKTVFIEPAEVVELSNMQRELEIDERREIIRLLIDVAKEIRPWIPQLEITYDVLGKFDYIAAKAQFAVSVDGQLPHFSTKQGAPAIWHRAVHPVLMLHLKAQEREVVPLDLSMGNDEGQGRIIVISGPNAGGKSVALKTVAIVQYMAQCGVLPTLSSNSVMKVMDSIFIDIGDDQSIDDDLSTYSSHLRNMKFFLQHGNSRTIFLVDEMGSGTEPQIGGALAQALLKEFNNKGMWGIVTTHYQNLKTLADETPGLINASMLYDRQRMVPMFKLSIGHPGSSFAVEIARKTGLPDFIIDAAAEIVGSDYVNLDKYLLDIARDKRYWESKRENIRVRNKQLEQTIEKYQKEAEDLRSKRREIIEEARSQARKIVEDSNAAVERTIREIKNAQADKQRTIEIRQELAQKRKEFETQEINDDIRLSSVPKVRKKKVVEERKSKDVPRKASDTVAVGSNVLLDGVGQVGTVMAIEGKKADVAFGAMKIRVPLSRLTITIRKPERKTSTMVIKTAESHRDRQLNFKPELDVRGFRADEALQAITYFIDDAVQFDIHRVRILHGTGTGALRMATRQYLETVRAVKSYHDEDVRFGGAGITVVNLE